MLARYREDHRNPVNRALHSVGIPTIIVSLAVLPFRPMVGLALFVGGWILQFVGHAFEGKRPSFMSDPRYLLVGPMWLMKKLCGGEPR